MTRQKNSGALSTCVKSHSIVFLGFFGVLLAAVCAYVGPWLMVPAMDRWTIQTNDHDEIRALLAIIGIRHLPMFLVATAFGNWAFSVSGNISTKAVGMAMLPYLVYVLAAAVLDARDTGETAWSWISYEPAYFIWPHFVAVPVGLIAARFMVKRKMSIGRPG